MADVLAKEGVMRPFLEGASVLESPRECALEAVEAYANGTIYVRKIVPCNIEPCINVALCHLVAPTTIMGMSGNYAPNFL